MADEKDTNDSESTSVLGDNKISPQPRKRIRTTKKDEGSSQDGQNVTSSAVERSDGTLMRLMTDPKSGPFISTAMAMPMIFRSIAFCLQHFQQKGISNLSPITVGSTLFVSLNTISMMHAARLALLDWIKAPATPIKFRGYTIELKPWRLGLSFPSLVEKDYTITSKQLRLGLWFIAFGGNAVFHSMFHRTEVVALTQSACHPESWLATLQKMFDPMALTTMLSTSFIVSTGAMRFLDRTVSKWILAGKGVRPLLEQFVGTSQLTRRNIFNRMLPNLAVLGTMGYLLFSLGFDMPLPGLLMDVIPHCERADACFFEQIMMSTCAVLGLNALRSRCSNLSPKEKAAMVSALVGSMLVASGESGNKTMAFYMVALNTTVSLMYSKFVLGSDPKIAKDLTGDERSNATQYATSTVLKNMVEEASGPASEKVHDDNDHAL